MINRIKSMIFPNICISFTLVTLLFSLNAVVYGGDFRAFPLFAVQFFAALWAVSLAGLLIERLNFKKAYIYPLLELTVNYAVFLSAAYFLKWIRFSLYNVLWILVLILVFYLNIYFRTRRQMDREAGQINRLLRRRV